MIDLHLHTTASDGLSTPRALAERAAAAGIRVFAVTDHDTVAGIPDARAAGAPLGLALVTGVEITAVSGDRDVHVLGYFFDETDRPFSAFLDEQRRDRRRRAAEIVAALAALGVAVDPWAVGGGGAEGDHRAVGRPQIARALIASGQVASMTEAFDRFLGRGRPAFVPRRGASPADVIHRIAAAGGCAALAHPGKLGLDDLVAPLVDAGLPAIEAFHPDHDPATVERYRQLARRFDLLVTGGSDFHGPASGRVDALGRIGLPQDDFDRLMDRFGGGRP